MSHESILNSMTVVQLRALLRTYNLPMVPTKSEMITSAVEHNLVSREGLSGPEEPFSEWSLQAQRDEIFMYIVEPFRLAHGIDFGLDAYLFPISTIGRLYEDEDLAGFEALQRAEVDALSEQWLMYAHMLSEMIETGTFIHGVTDSEGNENAGPVTGFVILEGKIHLRSDIAHIRTKPRAPV